MARFYGFLTVIFAFALVLTSQATPQVTPNTSLQTKVTDLEGRITALQKEVDQLQSDMLIVQGKQAEYDSIAFDLSTPGHYQRLDTSTGSFLVSAQGVEPYLDGYKITLNIGNPSVATYRGFTIHVKWSTAYDWGHYTPASYDKWNKAIQQKDISYTDALESGVWNKVEVILAPVSRDGLGYFEVSIDTNTVSLTGQ